MTQTFDVVQYQRSILESYNPIVIKSFKSKRAAMAYADREGIGLGDNSFHGHFVGRRVSPSVWVDVDTDEVRNFAQY